MPSSFVIKNVTAGPGSNDCAIDCASPSLSNPFAGYAADRSATMPLPISDSDSVRIGASDRDRPIALHTMVQSADPNPKRDAAKSALLAAIAAAPAPSGLPEPSEAIDRQVAALEACNPTASPTAAAGLLSGNWRTLYTTSSELLRLGKTLPGFKSRGIYQCIWAEQQLLCNVGEINGLPGLGGIVAVRATFRVESERRVAVKFLQAMVGSQAVMNYDLESFLVLMQHCPSKSLRPKSPSPSSESSAAGSTSPTSIASCALGAATKAISLF